MASLAQPLPKELDTLAAKTLAKQFGADGSAADWRRFGRAPGFTNRKPKHRNDKGIYPFALLQSHTGELFAATGAFHSKLLSLQQQVEQERASHRLSYAARPMRYASPVTLSRFRTSPRYQGRPAAADMAFCIAAFSQGWSELDITAALTHDYLSRDRSCTRQTAHFRRTLAKAFRWAA